MWAQSWSNILDITIPYPGKNLLDTTPNMQAQGYTPVAMLQLAEEFFLSMNMSALPPEFWAGSIVANPGNRIINCQASAWDFCNGRDYRCVTRNCTSILLYVPSSTNRVLKLGIFCVLRNMP